MATTKREVTMFTKLVRIGRDAELRSANNKPMLTVSVVYDVGWGQNKKAQWLNLVMFGQQAEKVAQHFTKGKQIVARVDDVHIDEYNGKSNLKGTLVSFEFVQEAKQQNEPQQQKAAQTNNLDDDLPF